MYAYFHRTELDSLYYDRHLRDRLPDRIIDAHAHFNLPEHVATISPETIAADWALECGLIMTYEDSGYYAATMFPGKQWSYIALPWPLRDADTAGNNAYIAQLIKEKGLCGLYTVRPEYDIAQIEKEFIAGGYSGFKPYPYMASSIKGANISIFDFMPHAQFELAENLHTAVVMHLPRAGRLPDPDNISEIRIILNRYPHVKLVLAHFGRCFQPEYFSKALDALGEDAHKLWFDCAAVMHPKVHEIAFDRLDHKRILFGTDLPIFLWHGKREWDAQGYHNLCREAFSWNKHPYPQEENDYTYFIYEQLNNMLNVIGDDPAILQDVFCRNAESVYKRRG